MKKKINKFSTMKNKHDSNQTQRLLQQLEEKRSRLNAAAEDEFKRTGNLLNLEFREEQKEFNEASQRYIDLQEKKTFKQNKLDDK